MHYMGGKFKIMKPIANIINEHLNQLPEEDRIFVSLFLGAGNVEQWISCKKILNDKHPYLMAMWQDLQCGRIFPSPINEKEYARIRANQDEDPGLTGFAGFGSSFSGKWWGGYARGKDDDYAGTAKRGLAKKIANGLLKDAILFHQDYKEVPIPLKRCVIYADPPYEGVTPFCKLLLGSFDHEEFWKYMRELSKRHIVFVSELNAPDDFECIWQQARKLDMPTKYVRVEKLFKWKGESD